MTDLMNLGKIKCITGKHHRDSIEGLKIKMGCELYLFTKNFPLLSTYCTNSCIISTRKFLWGNNMTGEKKTLNLKTQLHNGSLIIEYFLRSGLKGEELVDLNRCRIFLRSSCLSDLATGYENYISHSAWQVKAIPVVSQQHCPPHTKSFKKVWEKWKSALKTTY